MTLFNSYRTVVNVSSPLAKDLLQPQRDSRVSNVPSEAVSLSKSVNEAELEDENTQLHVKLSVAETNLQRIRTISKKAMDEFANLKQDLANEIDRRQRAELVVANMKLEISELLKGNTRLVKMDETLDGLHQDITMAMSQKAALEGHLKQMTEKKEAVERDIKEVVNLRHQSLVEA